MYGYGLQIVFFMQKLNELKSSILSTKSRKIDAIRQVTCFCHNPGHDIGVAFGNWLSFSNKVFLKMKSLKKKKKKKKKKLAVLPWQSCGAPASHSASPQQPSLSRPFRTTSLLKSENMVKKSKINKIKIKK